MPLTCNNDSGSSGSNSDTVGVDGAQFEQAEQAEGGGTHTYTRERREDNNTGASAPPDHKPLYSVTTAGANHNNRAKSKLKLYKSHRTVGRSHRFAVTPSRMLVLSY